MNLSFVRIAALPLAACIFPAYAQEANPAVVLGTADLPSPYIWVRNCDASLDGLPLKSTAVRATVAGVIAYVHVTQVYRNEGSKPIEAVYIFPGSTRAAISGMRMSVGDRAVEAVIRERSAARREYAAARAEGKTASLMEQERPNLFQMEVANILPGDEVRVELSYTELLVPREGVYSFAYPTVAGPRYSSTKPGEGTKGIPYSPDGKRSTGDLSLEVSLHAGLPIDEIHSLSHSIDLAWNGRQQVSASLKPGPGAQGDRDFLLEYRLAGGLIQSGLLLHKGATENFFLLTMQPPRRVMPESLPPRDFTFVLDVSGSMYGYPLATAKELLKGLVGGLKPEDRFNLVTFAAGQATLSPKGSLPATAANRLKALAFIDAQDGRGGSSILDAFRTALALPGPEGMSRTLVLVTDGYVSVESEVLGLIRENLGRSNVFAFGIGTSVNRHLIEGVARAGQGEAFIVTRPEQAVQEASRFRKYVASPVLSHVRIAFQGFDTYDVEPSKVPDVLADRPVICFGKWRGEPKGTVEISGTTGAGGHHQILHVADAEATAALPALPLLWARQRIQGLLDSEGLGARPDQAAITQLGLTYGLMTPYTSFVAVDSEIRNPGNPALRVDQPLPLPAGSPGITASTVLSSGTRAIGEESLTALPVACGLIDSGSALAPGVASATVEVTSTPFRAHDGATVAVCAATATYEEVDSAPPRSVMRRIPKMAAASGQVTLGALKADRPDVPLQRVTTMVETHLKSLTRHGLLRRLPANLTLLIQVDAAGAVTRVFFDRDLGSAGTELEALARTWRFAAWTTPGNTVLRLPLQVRR